MHCLFCNNNFKVFERPTQCPICKAVYDLTNTRVLYDNIVSSRNLDVLKVIWQYSDDIYAVYANINLFHPRVRAMKLLCILKKPIPEVAAEVFDKVVLIGKGITTNLLPNYDVVVYYNKILSYDLVNSLECSMEAALAEGSFPVLTTSNCSLEQWLALHFCYKNMAPRIPNDVSSCIDAATWIDPLEAYNGDVTRCNLGNTECLVRLAFSNMWKATAFRNPVAYYGNIQKLWIEKLNDFDSVSAVSKVEDSLNEELNHAPKQKPFLMEILRYYAQSIPECAAFIQDSGCEVPLISISSDVCVVNDAIEFTHRIGREPAIMDMVSVKSDLLRRVVKNRGSGYNAMSRAYETVAKSVR